MKVRNIVFSGAMASILMMGVATAATKSDVTFNGDFTIIGSEDPANVDTPISEPSKESFTYTGTDGSSHDLSEDGTDDIVQSDYTDTSAGSTEPDPDTGVSVTNTKLVSGMNISGDNYHYTYGEKTFDLKLKSDGDDVVPVANGQYNSDPITLLDGKQSDGISVSQESVTATNGESDFNANMFIITHEGQEYILQDEDGDIYLTRKTEPGVKVDATDGLATLLAEAEGYYDTAKGLVDTAKYNTSTLVDEELAEAAKAFAIYQSDEDTLDELNENWQSLVEARQNYSNDLSDFNAYESATDIYNAPILQTIENGANEAIELALGKGGAIKTAIDAGDAATLSAAKAYADAGDAKLRNDIASLDSKMNDLDENLSAGIASSVALSSVAVANVQKGEMSVGGGYGNYNSKSAMAFGAALGITDNWSANAGVGFGFGKDTKASFRVGTNYKFKLF